MNITKIILILTLLSVISCDDMILNNFDIKGKISESTSNIILMFTSDIFFQIIEYSICMVDDTNGFIKMVATGGLVKNINNIRSKTNYIEFHPNNISTEYTEYRIKDQLQFISNYLIYIGLNIPEYSFPRVYFKLLPDVTNINQPDGLVGVKTNIQVKWAYKLEDLTN